LRPLLAVSIADNCLWLLLQELNHEASPTALPPDTNLRFLNGMMRTTVSSNWTKNSRATVTFDR